MFPANWAASLYAMRRPTPIVWMCNDPPLKIEGERPEALSHRGRTRRWLSTISNWILKRYDRWLVRKMEAIVVLDHQVKRIVETRYQRDAIVVRSGVELKRFQGVDRTMLRKRYEISEDALIILCLGVLFKYRRFEDVISAMRILDDSKLRLFIVGSSYYDPSYASSLRDWAESQGVSKSVVFVDGFIPDEVLPQFYAGSDVFVFPNEQQTWGLAVIEAMASGTPCLVSRGAGVHEVLVHGETALLFQPRDPVDLASNLSILTADKALRQRLGAQGREFVSRNFSWESYSCSMLNIFNGIAHGQ